MYILYTLYIFRLSSPFVTHEYAATAVDDFTNIPYKGISSKPEAKASKPVIKLFRRRSHKIPAESQRYY